MISDDVRLWLKFGAYGGFAALFISIIGMVETFSQRDIITGVLSVGQTLLVMIALVTGYLTADRTRRRLNASHGVEAEAAEMHPIFGSLVAGLVVGLPLALLVVLADRVDLRGVLINVSPGLIDLLTLGHSTISGAGIALLIGPVFSILGGSITLMHSSPRHVVVSALMWFAFLGLISEVLRISLSGMPAWLLRMFITTKGFTPLGATIVFGLALAVGFARQRWTGRSRDRAEPSSPGRQRVLRYASWGAIFILLLILPRIVGRIASDVLVLVGIYALMGFGLNIVVGKAGLLDLGYVAFFAVGAYTTAILTSPAQIPGLHISFWAALPIVIALTGLTGVLIGTPVLGMRGDYLAIVTLGFGEIARFLALSDWFIPLLGGAQGVIKIPNARIGSLEFAGPQKEYYLVLFAALVALFISWRLEGSRVGRAWVAIREDEQVAKAMGIDTVYYKLLAFAMGAMIASLGGAIFAAKLGAIFPHSFKVDVSITVLSLLIIGGLGSLPGVIVGAFALVGLPELLREFSEYRLLLYGAVLIYMMIARPEGLLPSVRRSQELHEEEIAQDAWLRQAEALAEGTNQAPSK